MPLKLEDFTEQFQDWLASTVTDPVLTVGRNFVLGNIFDVQDMEIFLQSKILLTIFEEGSNLLGRARRTQQERTYRFAFKGAHGQEAVNRCWKTLKVLWNRRTFQTSEFRAWLARTDKLPTVVAANASGTYLADFVVTFNVWYRTE